MKRTLILAILLSIVGCVYASHLNATGKENELPIYAVLPFIIMLLCIAILPLINGTWWHKNFHKVSLVIGLPMVAATLAFNWTWVYHTLVEYASFITLLASLFIISGGILIKENLKISPAVNCIVLLIGAILASFIGTTGAAMLLIRPMIRLNKERKNKVHIIIFFIFIIANIGGCLTPLGDPPLFLGFLQGVPFLWTLKLLPAWAMTNGMLIMLFFIIDSTLLKKEKYTDKIKHTGPILTIHGKRNFLFLAGVLGAIVIYSQLPNSMHAVYKNVIQILIMALMAWLSWRYSSKKHRADNGFTWFPIKEVAILFAAIFASMIPALKVLEARGAELGVTQPYQFFWATGALSSFLDNAPTYLSFLSLGKSVTAQLLVTDPGLHVVNILGGHPVSNMILLAISMGAVFMGAMTYIGNGPNFMIKSVAEETGIKMPSFFTYMLWSICILIPIFILNTFVFFI